MDTLEPISSIAFSPWGDAVAVASPAAQLLGLDSVALAGAGQQPGVISLYACKDWQLVHQWGLRSVPNAALFLPACALQLLDGKRLAALQVLHLLVVPEQGEPGVVQGTRLLESEGGSGDAQARDMPAEAVPGDAAGQGAGATNTRQARPLQDDNLQSDIAERRVELDELALAGYKLVCLRLRA